MTMDLVAFKTIVKEISGLCFEEEKTVNLLDGIRARMSERQISTDSAYLTCIRQDVDEVHRLINLLTINETYFFREPVHFDLLVNKLFPEMLASRKPGEPVRILSAGCSTGEEPYSVMIKLLEKFGTGITSLVDIAGADIDSNVLGRAEQGLYSGLSFRGFPDALRESYFEFMGNNRYRIRDFVKEKVRFEKFNLMSDTYSEALLGMDAIFYRNVSIYFEPATQRRIFDKLAGLLNENGWLFVSSTETLAHNQGPLSLVERDGVFCYQKKIEVSFGDRRQRTSQKTESRKAGTAARYPGITRAPVPLAQKPFTPPVKVPVYDRSDRLSFDEALTLAKNKSYAEALSCINVLLEREPLFVKGHMLKAGILVNMKRFGEAVAVCLQSLEQDRWTLEAHLLLGLIAKIENDVDLAIKRFKEALYIQSSCWLAHFYVAEIMSARGDSKNSCREYEIVVNLLHKGDLTDHGLTFFPLAFPMEQIMHLCQHNISRLKQGKG